MMRWVIAASLRYRFLVVAAGAALLFFGAKQLGSEKVDVFPSSRPRALRCRRRASG